MSFLLKFLVHFNFNQNFCGVLPCRKPKLNEKKILWKNIACSNKFFIVDLLGTSLFSSIVGILLAFFVSIGGGFWGLLVSSSRVTRTFVMGCRTFVVIRYDFSFFSEMGPIKVNLCQKHSFLHQLTQNRGWCIKFATGLLSGAN